MSLLLSIILIISGRGGKIYYDIDSDFPGWIVLPYFAGKDNPSIIIGANKKSADR